MTHQQSLIERAQPTMETIPLHQIEPARTAAARRYTKRSIATFGQLSLPILQRIRHPSAAGEPYYRIVDGHRRITDLREGGHDEVQALILPRDTDDALTATLALSMNYARGPNPLVELEHLQSLREHGYEDEEIAQLVSMSVTKVRRRLKLRDALHPYLQTMLHDGKLAIGTAERIAGLTPERQQELVDHHQEHGERITNALVTERLQALRRDLMPEPMFGEVDQPPRAAHHADPHDVRALLEWLERFEQVERLDPDTRASYERVREANLHAS